MKDELFCPSPLTIKSMYFSPLFAIGELKIDSDRFNAINGIALFAMGSLLVMLIGILSWHFVPGLISWYRSKRAEKVRAENDIWFDANESVLHRGRHQLFVERKSFEYFVCKIILSAPYNYRNDQDVYDKFDPIRQKDRAVYQAVNRLNKKCRAALSLKDDLFKRGKNSTSVNDIYRSHIVDNS